MTSRVSRPVVQDRADYSVGEVMYPAVTTVETESHLAAAAYLMNHAGQTALVVVDRLQRPVAIITEADLLRAVAQGADTGEEVISDWMSRDPRTVDPQTPVFDAAQLMVDSAAVHLPVVSHHRVVGIVSMADIARAVLRCVRLSSAVVFVSDLERSLDFYLPLLRYAVTAADADAVLLAGPSGSQLYLRQTPDRPGSGEGDVGLQWVVWTAGSAEDLHRCAEFLSERGALHRRDDGDGVSRVEGRDPDGLAVIITYPGPESAPRHQIPARIRQS